MQQQTFAKFYICDSKNTAGIVKDSTVDLVVSGPPYWNEVVYSEHPGQLSRIEGYSEFMSNISLVWQECARALKPGGVLAFWVHDFYRDNPSGKTYVPFHADLCKTVPENMHLRSIFVWDRYLNRQKLFYPQGQALGTKIVYVLIFQKEGQNQNKNINETFLRYFWQPVWRKKTHPKLFGSTLLFRTAFEFGKLFSGIFDPLRQRINSSAALTDKYKFKFYTTEDPIDIAEKLIADLSQPGDLVLDPFAGSGTTLKAAVNLGRSCVGLDINHEVLDSVRKKIPSVILPK